MIEIDRQIGRFGTVRVLRRREDDVRLYCLGASVQTMATAEGVSLFGYVHAIKLLLRDAHDILLIGGAGASLATMLARKGCTVTVLDIDPIAEPIARRHFALDPRVKWVTADPFVYLGTARRAFDAIVVDACDDHGLVPNLARADALLAIADALNERGSLLVNLVAEEGPPAHGWDLACAMSRAGYNAALLRPEDGWEGNDILHARAGGPVGRFDISDVYDRPPNARSYLLSLRAHFASPADLDGARGER